MMGKKKKKRCNFFIFGSWWSQTEVNHDLIGKVISMMALVSERIYDNLHNPYQMLFKESVI